MEQDDPNLDTPSLSDKENPLEDATPSLEDDFLRGHFRQALAGANRRLRSEEMTKPVTTMKNHHAISSFTLWRRTYELNVHLLEPSSFEEEKDRIGAIALQTWYELWRRQQETVETCNPNASNAEAHTARNGGTLSTLCGPFQRPACRRPVGWV